MALLVRLAVIAALPIACLFAATASADYEGADGYGSEGSYEIQVSNDGYVREGQAPEPVDTSNYVVIEVEDGTSQEVAGETVIVVQEPEPVAATEHAPPQAKTVVVEQQAPLCSSGIWVDGYWAYSHGDYVWVDGHCVVERAGYVFVRPRWDFYASVWWFVPGYYRPCGVYVGFGYWRPHHWYPPYYQPYYRGHRPVPVHRGVPRRATTVTPSRRGPTRGVLPARPGYAPSRTSTVDRTARPTRTPTVNRGISPARTPTVSRAPATRTPAVARTPASRTSTVTRVPPTRTGAVTRVPPTRTGAVTRVPPTRTGAVTRAPGVGRVSTNPTLTGTVPRSGTVISQPRSQPTRSAAVVRRPASPARTGVQARPSSSSARTGSVRRPSSSDSRFGGIGRPSSSSARTSPIRSPGLGSSRAGSFGRPSMGGARPSLGGSRPSFGGFSGGRSTPTARGR